MAKLPTDGRNRVTDKAVRGLPLSSGQTVYWHPEISQLGVRVGAKSRTYFVQAKVVVGGRRRERKVTIGNCAVWNLEDATTKANELIQQMQSGIDPKQAATGVTTLRDLAARARESKGADYCANLESYFNGSCKMMDEPLASITGDAVERRYREIQEEVIARGRGGNGVSTANAAMRSLSAVWNLADALGVTTSNGTPLPRNPVPALSKRKLLKPTPTKDGRLYPEDMTKFWEHIWAEPFFAGRDLIIFMLLTGLRRGVASTLHLNEWNPENETLNFAADRNKSKRPLSLPVSKQVAALLNRRAAIAKADGYMFTGGRGSYVKEPRYALDKVCDRIGCDHVSVHDLRRTAASEFAFVMGEAQRKMLLDHSLASGGVTMSNYSVISAEDLRGSAQGATNRMLGYAADPDLVAERIASGQGTTVPSATRKALTLDNNIATSANTDPLHHLPAEEAFELLKSGSAEFHMFGKSVKRPS